MVSPRAFGLRSIGSSRGFVEREGFELARDGRARKRNIKSTELNPLVLRARKRLGGEDKEEQFGLLMEPTPRGRLVNALTDTSPRTCLSAAIAESAIGGGVLDTAAPRPHRWTIFF